MNYQTPIILPSYQEAAQRTLTREHYADNLFDRVTHTQRNTAPNEPTLQTSAVSVKFIEAWEGVGGFLLSPPSTADAAMLQEQYIELRSFRNETVATRARRIPYGLLRANDEATKPNFLAPLFLNAAHYPDQSHLEALRKDIYADATKLLNADFLGTKDEVTGQTVQLSREQRIALFLYSEVDGNFTVGINNALTLREELFHTMQSMLNVSRSYMSYEMLNDEGTPSLVASVLKQSKSEQLSRRNAGTETAYERMERRLGYLLSDRELQARIDKVCVEVGRVPEPYEDPVEFLKHLGLATGGIKDFHGTGNSIWERSIIATGKPSRAMAELNFAITAAFPDGVSDHFLNVALPYHMAQVIRVNSFDSKYNVAKQYGFERSKAHKPVPNGEPKVLRGLRAAAG